MNLQELSFKHSFDFETQSSLEECITRIQSLNKDLLVKYQLISVYVPNWKTHFRKIDEHKQAFTIHIQRRNTTTAYVEGYLNQTEVSNKTKVNGEIRLSVMFTLVMIFIAILTCGVTLDWLLSGNEFGLLYLIGMSVVIFYFSSMLQQDRNSLIKAINDLSESSY